MASSSEQHALNPTKETHSAKCRFYGVYLLCSQSPEKRFKGKCYIGFTVNPQRRISQHNRGMEFGGAKKTNNKGPWKMIMIVHNFPNNIAALQFEWAWQQPAMSTRLKNFPELKRKTANESYFQYNLRILSRMLNIGPWNRLPLAIRWLDESYECDFEAPFLLKPPAHMSIASGQIVLEKPLSKAKQQLLQQQTQCSSYATRMPECHLCLEYIQDGQSRIGCVNINCKLTCHMICLANQLLAEENQTGHYIPISGVCPICLIPTTWIELLQHKNKNNNSAGSLMSSEEEEEEESENDEAFDCYNNDCAAPAENEAFADEIFELSD